MEGASGDTEATAMACCMTNPQTDLQLSSVIKLISSLQILQFFGLDFDLP
jgi:hypothetical protein